MKQNNNILLAAGAALLILALRKRKQTAGVGAINAYKAISLAQRRGVDMTKDVPDLTESERKELDHLADELGYKQSRTSMQTYRRGEALFKSLRPTYKKISVSGIGRAPWEEEILKDTYTEYPIFSPDGDLLISWRDYSDSPAVREFIDQVCTQADNGSVTTTDQAYYGCMAYIAAGGKFTWQSVKQEVLSTKTNANADRKQMLSILASPAKGGQTILALAHSFSQNGGDDMIARDGICRCILDGWTAKTARDWFRE